MKKYNNTISKLVILTFFVGLTLACGDEKEFFTDIKPTTGVHLKVIHAAYDGLEWSSTPPAGVAVVKSIRSAQFLVNSSKVSGTSIVYGGAFPATDYTVLEAASQLDAVAPFTAAVIPNPELPEKQILSAAALDISGEGHFTVAITGPEASREVVVYEDNISSIPLDQSVYIRFIHLMANSVNGVDVVGVRPVPAGSPTGTVGAPITLFEDVTYKQATAFIALPDVGAYTAVQVKDALTGTVLATLSAANSIFNSNRVYTIFVRGQQGITASTEPKRPLFDRTTNR